MVVGEGAVGVAEARAVLTEVMDGGLVGLSPPGVGVGDPGEGSVEMEAWALGAAAKEPVWVRLLTHVGPELAVETPP